MAAICVAICWASGEVEIHEQSEDYELPEGVIPLARGEMEVLRRHLDLFTFELRDGARVIPPLWQCKDRPHDFSRVDILNEWHEVVFAEWPKDADGHPLQAAYTEAEAGVLL